MPEIHSPLPDFSAADAARLARERFGLPGEVVPLPGERDLNFRIDLASGSFVLKIAHAGETTREPRAAARGARPPRGSRARTRSPARRPGAGRRDDRRGRRRPRALATGRDSSPSCRGSSGPKSPPGTGRARRSSRASARPWARSIAVSPASNLPLPTAISSGICAGPAGSATISSHIEGAGRRALVERWLADFDRRVRPALDAPAPGRDLQRRQRQQHRRARSAPGLAPSAVAGVIDFGNLCQSNVVCEPAIAAAYAAMGPPRSGDGDRPPARRLPRRLAARRRRSSRWSMPWSACGCASA